MNKNLYERNIRLFHWITSLAWGRFVIPVIALFYLASKVSYVQFTVIMSVFSLTILVLEVPSGAIADLLGRKKTLFFSGLFSLADLFIISFFDGFTLFLFAKILGGISVSLSSGTFSSLIYETLKKLKREKEHKKISGSIETTSNIAKAIVFIVGAFLFSIHPKLPAFASLPFVAASLVPILMIQDPYIAHKKLGLKNSYHQFKEGFSYFFKNKSLVYISIFTFIMYAAMVVNFSLSSVYYEYVYVPIIFIGVVQFISSLIMAYGNKHAHWFEKKYGEKKAFFLLLQFTLIGLIGMSFLIPYVGVLFYLLLPLTFGFLIVLINNYMHDKVNETHRATMLSINNLFSQLGIFLLFPLMGYVQSEHFSLGYIILVILVLLFALVSRRYATKKKVEFIE